MNNNITGKAHERTQTSIFAADPHVDEPDGLIAARWWRTYQCGEAVGDLLRRTTTLWEMVQRVHNAKRPYVGSPAVDDAQAHIPLIFYQLAYELCRRLEQHVDRATPEVTALRCNMQTHAHALQPGEHAEIDQRCERFLAQLCAMKHTLQMIGGHIRQLSSRASGAAHHHHAPTVNDQHEK